MLVGRLLLPRRGPRALDHALVRGVLLVSDATLVELTLALSRARFDAYVSRKDRSNSCASWAASPAFSELAASAANLSGAVRRRAG